MKTWICSTLTSILAPMQGTARLYAYIKKQGHDVSLKDFNQEAYFSLLSRKYLEPTFEQAASMLELVKRNKFLREDMGSILLHSSSNAIRQMLLEGLLSNSPWYRFISPSAVKRPVFGILGSRIGPDNVIYALLADKEHVLSSVDRARDIL